ncbi:MULTISPECIES: hypothetical protein [unclassified Pseudoalteromonas]|uniref:hypothetical protein n=1 Tax=unclassified Pseudoalteromonas TaxID=194690 RepID=UPI001115AB9C|nr:MULTISPECIES: hypothetical protein [unclassified Pseudoalteromonas]MDN3484662.1 hypothetical protein [Pseudoalteromonas sp. APC 3224]
MKIFNIFFSLLILAIKHGMLKLGMLALMLACILATLGSVDLSRLNLQQPVWYLGKAEPMWCGYSP